MLVVISPAKRLDWAERDVAVTQPDFQEDAVRLATTARNLTFGNLKDLMGLSDDLARHNRDRFQAFEVEPRSPAPPRWPLPATPIRGWRPRALMPMR